jgi:hypothetical protein
MCNWIYVVIFDTIAMSTIFYTVVLLVIQGVALNTGVLPLSKGRTLHQVDLLVGPAHGTQLSGRLVGSGCQAKIC